MRVTLCDDSATVRAAYARLLESDPAIQVIGRAGDGQQALEAIQALPAAARPQVLLLDLEMPVMDGITALPLLLKLQPGLAVIVASAMTEHGASAAMAALRAGAVDYVPKPSAAGGGGMQDTTFRADLLAKVKGWARMRAAPRPAPLPPILPPRPARPAAPAAAPLPAAASLPLAMPPTAVTTPVTTAPPQGSPGLPPGELARGRRGSGRSESGPPGAGLSGTGLSGTAVSGAALSGTALSGAALSGAVLSGSRLSGTLPMVAPPAAPTLMPRPAGPPRRPRILAIGSSTGGPQALAAFIRRLTTPLPVPIVVVQHMPVGFTSMLADHLSRLGGPPAAEAADGQALQAGRLYVAPGDRHLLVEKAGGVLTARLTTDPPENFCRPAVDPMLRSVVAACEGAVLAVILTGMGQDGMLGCRAVAAAGGTVFAQDEASSVVWGMPGAVAKAGLAQALLPPEQLAEKVLTQFGAAGLAAGGMA
ncbi:chemotaxis protein CheB [Roseomonas sp. USHLN139]|uniref:chemotaxis protein CheB n=1 Tax=Roseomonas sp. USHLN139 TaxID=3081298 RepID=UPI003B0142D7